MRVLWFIFALALPIPALGQEFSALARFDASDSHLRDRWGGLELRVSLSQTVPFRVFTLADPARLILDFREVDWREADPLLLLAQTERADDLRVGTLRPGWSRMVVDLAEPLIVETAGMRVNQSDGRAVVTVRLRVGSEIEFKDASGAPPESPLWAGLTASDPTLGRVPEIDEELPVIVIDPGHGGVDPGAVRGGLVEADLMLQLARELAEAINRSGTMQAVLTRDEDVFVPLEARMTLARKVNASALLSLHADALEVDEARGASVYTLSETALDQASERMAERHDRGDLLAGLDLSEQDDRVATVLMDLARLETAPQSERLADAIVFGLVASGADVNSSPRRNAVLAVLTAADFPSVLVEVGFLSNSRDRQALTDASGRQRIVAGIVGALGDWIDDEKAREPLIRQ